MAELSEAEVYRACQRAFFVFGFPAGADEDAALAVTWLSALNLGGLQNLHGAMAMLRGQPRRGIKMSNKGQAGWSIDVSSDAGFFSAIEVIDYLCALSWSHKDSKVCAQVLGMRIPLMLLAVSALRSTSGIAFGIESPRQQVYLHNNQIWSLRPIDELDDTDPGAIISLHCIVADRCNHLDRTKDLSELAIEDYKLRVMGRRILIADHIWRDIKAVAAESFVPSSERSRIRGAGAELDDND